MGCVNSKLGRRQENLATAVKVLKGVVAEDEVIVIQEDNGSKNFTALDSPNHNVAAASVATTLFLPNERATSSSFPSSLDASDSCRGVATSDHAFEMDDIRSLDSSSLLRDGSNKEICKAQVIQSSAHMRGATSDEGCIEHEIPQRVLKQPCFGNLIRHDVFLNHRGPDLKMTFVSQLNKALCQAGCYPFLDAKALIAGQHGLNNINKALIGVQVHVAIFSRGYAESKYCLNELCDMLESKKTMIPVFYDVEPGDLRLTEVGPFAKAFCTHLHKGREKDVERWKAALLQASEISGFRLSECNNDTVKLEEKVVAAVLNALPPPPLLAPARHPVGLTESSTAVINMLHQMGDNVGPLAFAARVGLDRQLLQRKFTISSNRTLVLIVF